MNKQQSYTPDPRGIYEKYKVTKLDGTAIEGFHFVLRIPDPHAQVALEAYAKSVRSENQLLHDDIMRILSEIRGERS